MKYGICNELISDRDFGKACELIARNGFTGVEIAPFTLFADPLDISFSLIRNIGKTIRRAGLECIGFHWILKSPPGMLLLDGNSEALYSTWKRIAALSSICADLGGRFLVLGSGKERSYRNISSEQAKGIFIKELAALALQLENDGVKLLIEALPLERTNFINCLQEADEIIQSIKSSAISSMFDFHNCDDEDFPLPDLIDEYKDIIRHVHLNTLDGRHPKAPPTELYSGVFSKLTTINYQGWVSLEIFNFDEAPEVVLQETAAFLRELKASL